MLAVVSSVSTRARALASALRALPPYPAALLLACVLLCVAEGVLLPGPRTFGHAVYLASLLAALSVLAGGAWQLVLLVLVRADRAAYLVWPLLSLAAALRLAQHLSAFTQLGGPYNRLAEQTIAGSVAAGLGLGLALAAMQPTRRHPHGWVAAQSARRRTAIALAFLAIGVGFSLADHRLFAGLYPGAHLALRLSAALVLTLALVSVVPPIPLPRLTTAGTCAAIALLALPVALLRESQVDTIEALLARPWSAMVLRAARAALDFDRDGFAWVLGGGDCNDWNPGINPTAREIPNNGIDDNCAFGDRIQKPTQANAVPMPTTAPTLSVVLITIDTLRWDRLGSNDPAYGAHGRDTMPLLTRWSEQAVRFRQAYSPGAWTSIALGSVLRGLYARRLAFLPYYETTAYRLLRPPLEGQLEPGEQAARMFPLAFSDPHPSLAEWLRRRGMKTIAVVDDGFSQMLSNEIGIARGFDAYSEVNVPKRKNKKRKRGDDSTTADLAIAALHEAAGGRFFLWVHFFGPHAPNKKHADTRAYGDSVQDGYDHEVRYVDAQLGRVLAAIDALASQPAVFVTADHGEEFFGSYRNHGVDLSEQVLRVPLSARVPGWKPRNVEALVSLVDLVPTILALTQTPAPRELDGIDLAKVVGDSDPGRRVLFSDVWRYGSRGDVFTDMSAAYDGAHKLMLNRLDHSFSVQARGNAAAPAPAPLTAARTDQLMRKLLAYLEEGSGPLDIGKAMPR